MTPEERELINGLFERMRSFGAPEKDRDAEALISQGVRATPDAAYMLVQSVLVQEQALQEAGSRIQALEEQVRDLQGGRERTSGSGSFLGGLLGTGRAASEPRSGSVPQIGARATPSAYDDRRPWSPPQNAPPQQPASPPQAAGGGFLRSAMATAAGVAGGMLAAGAIRDMLGGGSAHANTACQQSGVRHHRDGHGGTGPPRCRGRCAAGCARRQRQLGQRRFRWRRLGHLTPRPGPVRLAWALCRTHPTLGPSEARRPCRHVWTAVDGATYRSD